MTPNDYQKLVGRTLIDRPEQPLSDVETMQIWCATGLAGEAGEILDYLKKGIFHRHGVDSEKIKEELGDLLWYLAGLATKFDLTLEEVMEHNVNKLLKRYPNGFSVTDSQKRNPEAEKAFADSLARF